MSRAVTTRLFLIAAISLLSMQAIAATFVVNSTGDASDADVALAACDTGNTVGGNPECTLRAAIEQANAQSDGDLIWFNIAGTGPHRIEPQSALPDIVQPVGIDGYTQPGASPNTLSVGNDAVLMVEINGSSVSNGSSVNGLLTIGYAGSNDGVTVQGLVLNGLPNFGMSTAITLSGSNHAIRGNFIGTDTSGTLAASDGRALWISGSQNVVGGPDPDDRNVISGSLGGGVLISPRPGVPETPGMNTVQNNYIGVKADGGATIAGSRGIDIQISDGNRIEGNLIAGTGILLSRTNDTVVVDNLIGVAADGVTPLGGGGIVIGTSNTLGAENNRIEANVIANSGMQGVVLTYQVIPPVPATRNPILSNSIYNSGQLGIDLYPDGVTANDSADADSGFNELQNFPVLQAVSISGGATTIDGMLESTPNTSFTVQFFASTVCDPSGYGEGERYLGETMAITDGAGMATFSATPLGFPAGRTFFTATATDPNGNTSEFSQCLQYLTGPGELQFSQSAYSALEDDPAATITVTRGGGSTGAVTVDYMSSDQTATAGADYQAVAGTLSFADGETTQSFDVTLIDDTLIEGDETVLLSLDNAQGGAALGAATSAVLTIVEDDTGADLAIGVASAVSVSPGSIWIVEYSITVSNDGPDPATGVIVSDSFPSNALAFVSDDSGGSYNPATGIWQIGNLDAGAADTLNISGRKLGTFFEGPVTYTATVSASEIDPDGANNTATNVTGVGGQDLAIAISDSPDPVPARLNDVGDVTYVLSIDNLTSPALTPDAAQGTQVLFSVSRGTLLAVTASTDDIDCVTDTGPEPGVDDTVSCAFASPFAGSAQISVVVSPPGGVTITATATVSSSRFDPDESNNSASEGTVVEAGEAGTGTGLDVTEGPRGCDSPIAFWDPDCCFIATAAYGSYLAPEVVALRRFRDHYLLTNAPGRVFVDWYYRYSPAAAAVIARHAVLRGLTRALLTPLVYSINYPVGAGVTFLLAAIGLVLLKRMRRSE